MYFGLHVKYLLFLSDLRKVEFSWHIFRIIQISNFIKIRPVAAKLFHADEQTDKTKLIVTFGNFANIPKKMKVN
jgi:hypothetical protein